MRERLRLSLFLFNRASYARMKSLIGHVLAHDQMDLTLVLSSSLLWEDFGNVAKEIRLNHSKAKVVEIPVEKQNYDLIGMSRAQA